MEDFNEPEDANRAAAVGAKPEPESVHATSFKALRDRRRYPRIDGRASGRRATFRLRLRSNFHATPAVHRWSHSATHVQAFGERNAVPGEILVRVRPTRVIGQAELAD